MRALEAVYAVERDDDAWLRGILEALLPSLDGGMGLNAWFLSADEARADPASGHVGLGHNARDLWRRCFEVVGRDAMIASLRMGVLACADRNPDPAIRALAKPVSEACGVGAFTTLVGLDEHRTGVGITVPVPPGATPYWPGRAWRPTLERLAMHLAYAARVRRRLAGARASSAAGAILDERARVVDAKGEATTRAAREALRDAALRLDRARSRRGGGAAHETVALWHALWSGQWTLIDEFDRDGRRYLVAVPNGSALPPGDGLTAREREAAEHAALGHSNKLIAYTLDVSEGTVATLLHRASRKLGVRSRAALVRRVRSG